MKPFSPGFGNRDSGFEEPRTSTPESQVPNPESRLAVALRRFRHPVPARVRVAEGKPARVAIDRRGFSGGGVDRCAGPWRTSGDWWRTRGVPAAHACAVGCDGWDRDEWDVTLTDGATYRLFRARDTEQWFVDGVVD